MLLFRATKKVKTGKGLLDYDFDRHDLFVDGDRVMCWAMTPAHGQTVTKRQFASAGKARAWFKARVAQLLAEQFTARPLTDSGWTIGPKGQRRTWTGKTFTSVQPWGEDVAISSVDVAGEAKLAKKKAKKRPTLVGDLAKLAHDFAVPTESDPWQRIVGETNAWFSKLVAAGLDLEPFGHGAKVPAIRATGRYTAKAVAEFAARLSKAPARKVQLGDALDWSNVTLPEHYVEVLRECGALSVLTDFRGAETMFPLVVTKGWPLGSDVKSESDVLNWEVERHGEPGSFAGAHIRVRRWLRVCANAPGGSDHFSVLDLNRTNSAGAAALYRVDDIGLPTTVSSKATVYSFKAWLVRAVGTMHKTAVEQLSA